MDSSLCVHREPSGGERLLFWHASFVLTLLNFILSSRATGELFEKERLHSFAWLSQGRLKNREGSGISSEAMKVDYRVDVDIKHLKK